MSTRVAIRSLVTASKQNISSSSSLGIRWMSSTAKVWIDKNTKVICQGFTGKQVCNLSIKEKSIRGIFCKFCFDCEDFFFTSCSCMNEKSTIHNKNPQC